MTARKMIPIPESWHGEHSNNASEILVLIDQLDRLSEDALTKSQAMEACGLPLPFDAQHKLMRTHHNIHKMSPLRTAKWSQQDGEYLIEKQHKLRYLPTFEGRPLVMATATPLLRWDEFKHRFYDLSGDSAIQMIVGFASALLAFLYGEVTLPLGVLLFSSTLRLIIGNCPAEEREAYSASSVYIKMYKRFQYFMAPFLLVAVANLVILTLAYTVNISEEWASRLMVLVPAWFALSEGRSAFISLLSYRTPGTRKFYKLGSDLKRAFLDFISLDE